MFSTCGFLGYELPRFEIHSMEIHVQRDGEHRYDPRNLQQDPLNGPLNLSI